jgi:hypothetical protein
MVNGLEILMKYKDVSFATSVNGEWFRDTYEIQRCLNLLKDVINYTFIIEDNEPKT